MDWSGRTGSRRVAQLPRISDDLRGFKRECENGALTNGGCSYPSAADSPRSRAGMNADRGDSAARASPMALDGFVAWAGVRWDHLGQGWGRGYPVRKHFRTE